MNYNEKNSSARQSASRGRGQIPASRVHPSAGRQIDADFQKQRASLSKTRSSSSHGSTPRVSPSADTGAQRRRVSSEPRRQQPSGGTRKNPPRKQEELRRRSQGASKTAQARSRSAQGQKAGRNRQGTRVQSTQKRIPLLIALVLLVAAAIFYVVDGISNFGVIHSGVRVGTVEVGHLNSEEAATLIDKELGTLALSAPVVLYGSEEARERGQNQDTLDLTHGVDAEALTGEESNADSWSVSFGTFDAQIDSSGLAEEAYGVGRGFNFILGRPAASLFGVEIEPKVEFSSSSLSEVKLAMSGSMDNMMQNPSISFDGTEFVAHDGQSGLVVDDEQFAQQLQTAFLSEERSFVVPMEEGEMQVGYEDAQSLAKRLQAAIKDPLTITYNELSWQVNSTQLGQLVRVQVEDSSGTWELVPHVEVDAVKSLIAEVAGSVEPTVAPVDAYFAEVDGKLTIVPEENGTGIDYARLATSLESTLFGTEDGESTSGERVVQAYEGELEASFTAKDAQAYDFDEKISEYTIEYPTIAEGSKVNLENTARLVNSSIIAPQSEWSLIDTVVDFSAENGYVMGQIIIGDTYYDGMGGGTCNVATTVFNAIWEAGYPITERSQHSLRGTRYPLGRDAAIAYPGTDLKFINDTDNYLLLTVSADGEHLTATFWGIPPGYVVESYPGEFIETGEYRTEEVIDENLAPGERVVEQIGLKASQIEVKRVVYDAEGNFKEEKTYYSSYYSTAEIVRVGPPA